MAIKSDVAEQNLFSFRFFVFFISFQMNKVLTVQSIVMAVNVIAIEIVSTHTKKEKQEELFSAGHSMAPWIKAKSRERLLNWENQRMKEQEREGMADENSHWMVKLDSLMLFLNSGKCL